jgi:hypothetical protein
VIGAADDVQRFHFHRVGDTDSPRRRRTAPSAPAPVVAAASRHVVINERALSDEELAQVEQAYQIRIPRRRLLVRRDLGSVGREGRPDDGLHRARASRSEVRSRPTRRAAGAGSS